MFSLWFIVFILITNFPFVFIYGLPIFRIKFHFGVYFLRRILFAIFCIKIFFRLLVFRLFVLRLNDISYSASLIAENLHAVILAPVFYRPVIFAAEFFFHFLCIYSLNHFLVVQSYLIILDYV